MARKVRAVLVMLAVIGVQLITVTATSAGTTCGSSGSGFTVDLCLTTPSGPSVSGEAAVTITVTITGSSTSVARVNTYLDGQWLLEDVAAPYTFVIPTSKFVDGNHVLSATATLRAGFTGPFTTPQTSTTLNFSNGVTQPPVNTNTFTPRPGTTPAPGAPLVFAAAGDGAGGRPEADNVVSLIKSWNPNLFGYIGDVYAKGTPTEFYNWYGHAGSKWNALYDITNPITGNHEYESSANGGYDDYWNNVPDYYSYTRGAGTSSR